MSSIDRVVHASELKQVPVAGYNPTECIRTNVNDAENEIGAVLACRVEKVIELSVDKKASLINLYGAIKLLSDKVFMAANNIIGSHKRQFAVTLWQRGGSTVRVFFRKLAVSATDRLPITDVCMTHFGITLQQGGIFVLSEFECMYMAFVLKIPSVYI